LGEQEILQNMGFEGPKCHRFSALNCSIGALAHSQASRSDTR
jgi:hypothetical protein